MINLPGTVNRTLRADLLQGGSTISELAAKDCQKTTTIDEHADDQLDDLDEHPDDQLDELDTTTTTPTTTTTTTPDHHD